MVGYHFLVREEFPTKAQRLQSLYNQFSFLCVLSAFVGNKIETDTLLR